MCGFCVGVYVYTVHVCLIEQSRLHKHHRYVKCDWVQSSSAPSDDNPCFCSSNPTCMNWLNIQANYMVSYSIFWDWELISNNRIDNYYRTLLQKLLPVETTHTLIIPLVRPVASSSSWPFTDFARFETHGPNAMPHTVSPQSSIFSSVLESAAWLQKKWPSMGCFWYKLKPKWFLIQIIWKGFLKGSLDDLRVQAWCYLEDFLKGLPSVVGLYKTPLTGPQKDKPTNHLWC